MADGADNTQLVTIDKSTALEVFTTPGRIDPLLAKIRTEIDAFVPDLTTKSGRDNIASIAYRVARSKTYIDGIGKELVDKQKEIPKKIDATRKHIRDTLDAWRDEVRKPLTEWEAAEKERLDMVRYEMARMQAEVADRQPLPSDALVAKLEAMQAFVIDANLFEDATDAAANLKTMAVAALTDRVAEARKREDDAALLAQLMAEKAARDKQEQQERERRESEEAIALQQKVLADQVRREAEQAAAVERAKADAAIRAAQEEAERKDLEHKLELAAAERRAQEAAEKVRRDAEDAKRREEQETAKREADRLHTGKINRAALDALMALGVTEELGKRVVGAIALGQIPNVSIRY